MKEVIFIVLQLFFLSNYSQSQSQRMAVLPSEMNYSMEGSQKGAYKTICLDPFKYAPKKGDHFGSIIYSNPDDIKVREFRKMGDKFEMTGIVENRNHLEMFLQKKKSQKKVSLNNTDFFVIGKEKENISDHYLEFIRIKIDQYRNLSFGPGEHIQLQNEIWAYRVLEEYGDLTKADSPLNEFKRAKKLFLSDFGYPYSSDLDAASFVVGIGFSLNEKELAVQREKIISKIFESSGVKITEENIILAHSDITGIAVIVKNSDDFIRVIEKAKESTCNLEFCITDDNSLSVIVICGAISFEISTFGEIILTFSDGEYNIEFSNMQPKEGCETSGTICLNQKGKKTETIELTCTGKKPRMISNQDEFVINSSK